MDEGAFSAMPSGSQEFCLRWNNFHSSLVSALDGFKNEQDFVDVTIACEGQYLKAHKMLLSACSVFFRDLLKANPCQHPIIILPPEVRFLDLERLLRFIYQGEVNVQQESLAKFLKTAEMLKIRGLADDSEKQKVFAASSPRPPEGSGNSSVSPKRPRLSLDAQEPSTPNDDSSRLSGPDSDSEMIPVKQEMIELKDGDLESADNESFLSDSYIKDSSSSVMCDNSQSQDQGNQQAPPPPGPLLPSYIPPPQARNQEDSLSGASDGISQGTYAHLIVDHLGSAGSITSFTSTSGCSPSPSNGNASKPLSSNSPNQVPRNILPKCCPSHDKSSDSSAVLSISGASQNLSGQSPQSTVSFNLSSSGLPQSLTISPISTPLNSSTPSRPLSLVVIPSPGVSPPLTCDMCFKNFTSRSNLNKHKRVQHSGEEYVCPICKRTFRNRYYIKEHVLLCSTSSQKKGTVPSGSSYSVEPAESTSENDVSDSLNDSDKKSSAEGIKKEGSHSSWN